MTTIKKKHKVVMLPTSKKDTLRVGDLVTSLRYGKKPLIFGEFENSYLKECTKQHLYIISDDEIKKGDWFMSAFYSYPIHYTDKWIKKQKKLGLDPDVSDLKYHKIIATTDTSLTKTNFKVFKNLPSHKLPSIPQSFVKKYAKNNNIDEILVEYDEYKDISVIPEYSEVIDYTLKVNSNNEITIHPIKDCYTREEVEVVLFSLAEHYAMTSTKQEVDDFNKWVEENL